MAISLAIRQAQHGDPSALVPAFYVSPAGNDAHAGTEAAPFATIAHAITQMTASMTKKTTYLRGKDGVFNLTAAFTLGAGQTLIGYPGDPIPVVNNTVAYSGATGVSGITLKNINFNGALNDGSAVLQFANCPALAVQGCGGGTSAWQQWLNIYNSGAGLRVQGCIPICPTIGATGADIVVPINLIYNDGAGYSDIIVNSNSPVGGTFGIQAQCIMSSVTATFTDCHCDWNNCTKWGNNASTKGNEGISWVLSTSTSNSDNTCTGNTCIGNTGLTPFSLAFECQTAGCTYADNVSDSLYGFALAGCSNSLFTGNNITASTMAFSNDGAGWTAPVAATVEIATNTINGSSVTGAGTPTNLVPLPSGTGLPVNTPSAPYTG